HTRCLSDWSSDVCSSDLRTTAVVIYGTLIVLAFTIPQSIVNWAKNFEPSRSQEAILVAAEALQAASDRTGLNRPYHAARQLFLEIGRASCRERVERTGVG